MIPPKMNVDRSQSDFKCEKDNFDPSDPFPHVFPIASDAAEPDFSAHYSLFPNVNHSKLQDIAITVKSAIAEHQKSQISSENFTRPCEFISNKNLIETSRAVDGQKEPAMNRGVISKRLIKRPLQEPCVWKSEKKSWRKAMAKLKSPQPFIAFPHDYPVVYYPKYIPDFLNSDYKGPTPEPNEPPVGRYVQTSKRSSHTDEKERAAKRSRGSESPYGLPFSSTNGEKMKLVKPGSGEFCPITGPSCVDHHESLDRVSSSGYDGDSSQSEADSSDENASPSAPSKSLKKVRFANT